MSLSKKTKDKPADKPSPLVKMDGGKIQGSLNAIGKAKTVNIYTGPPPGTTSARALRRYREWVVRQCAHIDLGDLGSAADAGRSGGRLKLARIYVELDTTSQAEPEKGRRETARQPGAMPDAEGAKRLTAVGALLKHRRLALLGLLGSGKTTFLRHLSLHLAAKPLPTNQGVLKELALKLAALPNWPAAEADLVPITVVLRRFAAECAPKLSSSATPDAQAATPSKVGHACHLWDFIQSNLREENLADAAEPLREALEAGRAIVFFDGLDEVPDDTQKQFVCQAVDKFARSSFAPSRMVITCRTFSYRDQDWVVPGFTDVELGELDDPRINQFIEAWFEALSEEGVVTAEQARNKSATLWPAIRERGLHELAGNPLQLTNMAVLHRVETLPDNRALLYDRLVRLLLLQWDKVRFDKDKLAVPLHALREEADCREEEFIDGLAWLAWQVHDPNHGGQAGHSADVSELELRGALERLHPSQDQTEVGRRKKADWALRVAAVFRQRGALLREEGRGVFRFPHRSYQEFLAGRHLAQQNDFAKKAAGYVDDSRHWWEVVRWAANYMACVKRSLPNSLGLATELRAGAGAGETTPLAWRKAYLAGDILAEIGVSQVRRGSELGETCLAQTRQLLTQLIGNDILPAKERALAGVTLGKLGDERPGVVPRALEDLMQIEFCYVPPGRFWMGDGEKRQPNDSLDYGFWIARFPITVAQFNLFVKDGGYAQPQWWETARKVGMWQDGKVRGKGWSAEKRKWVHEWRDRPVDSGPRFTAPNHPIVDVNWYEALAFCRWLEARLRPPQDWQIALPSEAEWEKAARGGEQILAQPLVRSFAAGLAVPTSPKHERNPNGKRTYPWEGDFDPNRANCMQTQIGATSAVGCFPGGASPCGAEEMSGNVWEWTRSLWSEKRENLDAPKDAPRVLRGGSLLVDYPERLRCACRSHDTPASRSRPYGFRCVCCLGGSAPGRPHDLPFAL